MKDRICELECNIDDMTGEEIAFAAEMLMAGGARDVTLAPVGMKKGRPATMMTVMCGDTEAEKSEMIRLIFKYTSTIGIREVISERYILDREKVTYETPLGTIRAKKVSGYGTARMKYEYEDLARIARDKDISIPEARALAGRYCNNENIIK